MLSGRQWLHPFLYLIYRGKLQKRRGFAFKKTAFKTIEDAEARRLLNWDVGKAIVQVTEKNYDTAIRAFDSPWTHPLGYFGKRASTEDDYWNFAFETTYKYLRAYIPVRKPKYNSLKMDFSTAPGYPLNQYFEKKNLVPEEWIQQSLYSNYGEFYWNLAMKRERLPLEKIRAGKMRSFMMPSMTMLMYMKIFFQDFNEALKLIPWLAYGMNWHRKGFHRAMAPFDKFYHKAWWDVSKWDKRYPLKYYNYKMRERFLEMNRAEADLFWKIAADEIIPTVLMPTGEVYNTLAGQCSGSDGTTTDNCVGHLMIIFYDIGKGFKEIHGEFPTLPVIMDNCAYKIYGDDVCNAYSRFFKFLGDKQRKATIYASFGMALDIDDPLKYGSLTTMEGLQFLGFTVKEWHGTYVPYYSYDNVRDSTVLTLETETPKQQVIRFCALLELLTFTEHYEEYKLFIFQYCDQYDLERPFILSQDDKINWELCKQFALPNKELGEVVGSGGRKMNVDIKQTSCPKTLRSLQRLTYGNTRPKSSGQIPKFEPEETSYEECSEEDQSFTQKGETSIEESNQSLGRNIKRVFGLHCQPSNQNLRGVRSGRNKVGSGRRRDLRQKFVQSKGTRNNRRNRRFRRNIRGVERGLQRNRRQKQSLRGTKRKTVVVKGDKVLMTTDQLSRMVISKPLREKKRGKVNTSMKNERGKGLTRRKGYKEPMSFRQPEEKYTDYGMTVGGSEFLTFLQVYGSGTTSPLAPTQAGDTLYTIPLQPEMMAGTRIEILARNYQKYKWEFVDIEFVPSVPVTQDGSLMMTVVYDPLENTSVTTTDTSELMRMFLSHKGANIFNICDYGRCSLTKQPDTLKNYYVDGNGTDFRDALQAYFLCCAGSSYTNTSTTGFSAGSFVIHYKIHFYVRDIVEPVSLNITGTHIFSELTTNNTFSSLTVDAAVALTSTCALVPSHTDYLFQLTFRQSIDITGFSPLSVYDTTGQMSFGMRGSVWWGRFQTEAATAPLYIYSSMENAMDPDLTNKVVRWNQTITSGLAINSGYVEAIGYRLTEKNNE